MSRFEYRIKLLISGLLVLTAFLIAVLVFFTPQKTGQREKDSHVNTYSGGKIPRDGKGFPVITGDESAAAAASGAGAAGITGVDGVAGAAEADGAVDADSAGTSGVAGTAGATALYARPEKREKALYFIIDDAGYSLEKLRPFLDFPGKLTIAVLPGLDYSEESAILALEKGKKVILHQPMEAVNGNDTGPHAIKKGMEKGEITDILDHNFAALPGAAGMNNHMGSAVTKERQIMEIVLQYLKEKNLLFIDSLTTPDSVSKEVASELGMAIEQRDIFLDNVDNREAIMESLNQGKQAAENRGYAVMIGHVWSSELADTMMQIYPNLIEEGFTLKDASEFLLGEE